MARHVYEARESGQQVGKIFGQVSGASKFLRETYGCSFPSGSVGNMKAGVINSIETTGKSKRGEKIKFVLMRHEVL